MMNWPAIEDIVFSESDNPFETLGPHDINGGILYQVYYPGAKRIMLQDIESRKETEMEMVDEEGFFAIFVSSQNMIQYQYIITDLFFHD